LEKLIMKNRYGILICIFSIMVLLINDRGLAMAGRSYDDYREKLKEVDLSDGVSKDEAIIIAQNDVIDSIEKGETFFKKLGISKAKIFEDPWYIKKFPEDWVVSFPIRRGFSLMGSNEYITFVNKKTGKVVHGGERK